LCNIGVFIVIITLLFKEVQIEWIIMKEDKITEIVNDPNRGTIPVTEANSYAADVTKEKTLELIERFMN